MNGMPLAQALAFLGAAAIIILAARWRPIHPFLLLIIIAAVFGYAAGYPTAQIAGNFGSGFADKIYSPGLVIVAASLVAALAEGSIASHAPAKRGGLGGVAVLGLFAGMGSSPAAAFVILIPLLPHFARQEAGKAAPLALALAISASHGLLLTPVAIAAVAILGADWHRVALFGLPLAAALIVAGAMFARLASVRDAASLPWPPATAAEKQAPRSLLPVALAVAVPLLLLIVQSFGDIPSEPFGGGPARELILGVGRPFVLFLVGVGIMTLSQPRRALALAADTAWCERVLGRVAGVLLIVGAAGGLQRLCQETGMAEMLGEHLLSPRLASFGVLVPFVIAAVMKTLQGSSLVAAITAAGMAEPMLAPLGLDGADGRALAALAVGAGAMTISHVNDEYFWLVTQTARLSPLRGVTTLSLGTLVQGAVAAAALLALAAMVSHA
jgi:GntP family gluconate:H+ symporter